MYLMRFKLNKFKKDKSKKEELKPEQKELNFHCERCNTIFIEQLENNNLIKTEKEVKLNHIFNCPNYKPKEGHYMNCPLCGECLFIEK